jgi:hypothetical protein
MIVTISSVLLASTVLVSACVPGSTAPSAAVGDGRPRLGPAVVITVRLVEATQGPLPIGLPTRFEISLPALPDAGASVEAEWQAVDGDESREPRRGRGVITLDAEGAQLTIALRRADATQTDERALTLRGAIEASALRGTFSDRLFAFRAGTFEGVVVS